MLSTFLWCAGLFLVGVTGISLVIDCLIIGKPLKEWRVF